MSMNKRAKRKLAAGCVAALISAGGGAAILSGGATAAGTSIEPTPISALPSGNANATAVKVVRDLFSATSSPADRALAKAGSLKTGDTSDAVGRTVTRGPVKLDIASDADEICVADWVNGASRPGGWCADLPYPKDAIPAAFGNSKTEAWLETVVPDYVTSVTATNEDGASRTLKPDSNIAVVVVPGTSPIASFSWRTADGATHRRTIGPDAPK